MNTNSVSHTFTFRPARSRNGKPKPPPMPANLPKGNVPRVARLLALAHHFEKLRADGVVVDYADLARLGGVTRARMTQIMSLLNLAPDIQEAILYLPRTRQGRDVISTKKVLLVAQEMEWGRQRLAWKKLVPIENNHTENPELQGLRGIPLRVIAADRYLTRT